MIATRFAVLLLAVFSSTALADESCRAHYTFDGNLNDNGGNGYDGAMVSGSGALVKPNFVEGKYGQALALDGSAAMAAMVDLRPETCPFLTFTAWIRVGQGRSTQTEYLVSTGFHTSPGLNLSGDSVSLRGHNNALSLKGAQPSAGWIFVAGVYDHVGSALRLHVGTRDKEEALAIMNEPDPTLWVGAFNDQLSYALNAVAVDDLRIYDRAFTVPEIETIRKTGGPAPGSGSFVPAEPGGWAGRSCVDHPDCGGGGAYCAFDNTCHPESHLPKIELALVPITPHMETVFVDDDSPEEPSEDSTSPGVSFRIPRPGGSETVIAYSGSIGNISRRLDLFSRGNFLNSIAWTERGDRPCSIGIHTQPIASEAGALADTGFRCRGLQSQTMTVNASGGTYVHAIQVCNNRRNTNYRLKGVRVWGARINADGSLTTEHNSDTEELTNCTDWAPKRACPSGQIATGLVVLANETGGEDKANISGLQLICHDVEMPAAN